MDDSLKSLTAIGFSEYEAKAYGALLVESPANGYQISKLSGVPRAKIYECLERLAMRGAVVRVDSPDPEARLYAPTDPNELIRDMEKNLGSALERARESLNKLKSDPSVVEVLWRVTSQRDLVAKGRTLTGEARRTLHVALWDEEFDSLLPDLERAAERGLKMALVLYGKHAGLQRLQDYGVGAILHGRVKRQAIPVMGRQFALVSDGERCITGSIFEDDKVEGVFTMNKGLVTNAVDLVNHEIYLERIILAEGDVILKRFGKNLQRLDAFDSPFKDVK